MMNPVREVIKTFAVKIAAACGVVLAAAIFMPSPVVAQQLYISNISVYYNGTGTGSSNDAYCGSAAENIDVSGNTPSNVLPSGATNPVGYAALIAYDQPGESYTSALNSTIGAGYPHGCLTLCVALQCVNNQDGTTTGAFGIDELNFQIFKYASGSNPLDPSSTPPLRTITMYNIGKCPGDPGTGVPTPASDCDGSSGAWPCTIMNPVTNKPYFCSGWDGYYNVDTTFGKVNGEYGFRAEAKTNETTVLEGNISIDQTAAYPGENQYPITVNVTDVHSVSSTPTIVGNITSVGAEPYNIKYRLSKDASVNIWISTANSSGGSTIIRHLLTAGERYGEGLNSLTNGDPWDGRDDNGVMLSSGNYLASITAYSNDIWGTDTSVGVTAQISLTPLQITDLAVASLGSASTATATISYFLTESATVYVRIYQPDTTFSSVSSFTPCNGSNTSSCGPQPACSEANSGGTCLLFSTAAIQSLRTSVSTTWDGRDQNGNVVSDNSYTYILWAEMPGRTVSATADTIGTITTPTAYEGIVSVARGAPLNGTAPAVASTIIGSSPSVAALPPFYYSFNFARPVTYDFNIKTSTNAFVRHLYSSVSAQANSTITVNWDGTDDNGYYVSSGTYMAELVVTDPLSASKTYRYTTLFSANLFRITDVATSSLLTSSSGTISYLPTQTMNIDIRVYPVGTSISTAGTWPPLISTSPIITFTGVRPAKYKATEYWNGYNPNNNTMEADGVYPVLILMYSSATIVNYNTASNAISTTTNYYATDRVVTNLTISRGPVYINNVAITPTYPTLSNSTATVQLPPYEIAFVTTRISSMTIEALSQSSSECGGTNNVCRYINQYGSNIFTGGTNQYVYWDGKDNNGNYLPSDSYTIQLVAYNYPNTALQQPTTYQDNLYVNNFQVYDVGLSDLTLKTGQAAISYQISVPMKVAIQVFKPGTTFDSAGNPTPTIASGNLVKVIGGVRPQLTSITDTWDGTDRSGRQVADGTYVFRIVTSTDTNLLDSNTGQISGNNINYVADKSTYLSPVTVSVAHGESSDPCADLATQALFYPNPLRQSRGCFNVGYTPITGYYDVKLYNIAGDLVNSYSWGLQSNQSKLNWDWNRTNAAGNKVARGVYFAVFKLEATTGGKQICQTIKKILIPSNDSGASVSQGCY